MAPNYVGFGVEIETSVKPVENRTWSPGQHFEHFAETLEDSHGLEAIGNRLNTFKYPDNYEKWWITGDSSIRTSYNFST